MWIMRSHAPQIQPSRSRAQRRHASIPHVLKQIQRAWLVRKTSTEAGIGQNHSRRDPCNRNQPLRVRRLQSQRAGPNFLLVGEKSFARGPNLRLSPQQPVLIFLVNKLPPIWLRHRRLNRRCTRIRRCIVGQCLLRTRRQRLPCGRHHARNHQRARQCDSLHSFYAAALRLQIRHRDGHRRCDLRRLNQRRPIPAANPRCSFRHNNGVARHQHRIHRVA